MAAKSTTTTKSRPILFSAPMVRALLAGTKTQTRRIVKPQPAQGRYGMLMSPNDWAWAYPRVGSYCISNKPKGPDGWEQYCPYGKIGDLLIVKENAWMFCERVPNGITPTGRPKFRYVPLRSAGVFYCANHPDKPSVAVVHEETGNVWGWRKNLGRFVPYWACRMRYELARVGLERVNQISIADCIAEGVEHPAVKALTNCEVPSLAYAKLWELINGKDSWDENPWVWVLEFRRVEQTEGTK